MHLMFGTLVLNWSSITIRPRKLTCYADLFEVEPLDVWPTANGHDHDVRLELAFYVNTPSWKRARGKRTESCFPSLAASVVTNTFPSFFSAERTLVPNLNLIPCFVKDFWS